MWTIMVGDADELDLVEVLVANAQNSWGVYLNESDPLFEQLMKLADTLTERSMEAS